MTDLFHSVPGSQHPIFGPGAFGATMPKERYSTNRRPIAGARPAVRRFSTSLKRGLIDQLRHEQGGKGVVFVARGETGTRGSHKFHSRSSSHPQPP